MERFIRLPEVKKRTALPTSTIYHYIQLGLFPKQYLIGQRSVAWKLSEIEGWLASAAKGGVNAKHN